MIIAILGLMTIALAGIIHNDSIQNDDFDDAPELWRFERQMLLFWGFCTIVFSAMAVFHFYP